MEYDNPLTDEHADNSNQRDERKVFQKQRLILVVDGVSGRARVDSKMGREE